MRGHQWADNTSIGDAQELVGDGAQLGELGPVLARMLENRARMDGEGWSVADCHRVNWHRRRVEAWEREIYRSCAVGWPGGSAWIDLRCANLLAEGWTPMEIARLVGIPARSIRKRSRRLGESLRWSAICPAPLH